MLERFTTAARTTVLNARTEARQLGHPQIGTEHLLLALLQPGTDIAHDVLTAAGLRHDTATAAVTRLVGTVAPFGPADVAALEAIGIDLDAVRARLEETFGRGALDPAPPKPRRGLFGRRTEPRTGRFGPRAKVVLELALREALRLHHNYIGTEHLLLGIIREQQGLAAKVITDAGVDLRELRRSTEAAITASGRPAA
ncbi:Clp protease N-terminal domain-containing protein [Catellatospora sp. KI3]|uniref:Clp protease N-terminal domain-containing protein n=1 Tax=Catellatospora sp. KI3 TaxID=3041620 RepID=UPI00248323DC|nr:Clp protease N-terminal domain-containing protein [Catellatospora sp. KI3]MDI1463658.1 Clp protease N-terminal domain-containing protein [Catellatospora sp. KI3]